jgi:hypothetical protein
MRLKVFPWSTQVGICVDVRLQQGVKNIACRQTVPNVTLNTSSRFNNDKGYDRKKYISKFVRNLVFNDIRTKVTGC